MTIRYFYTDGARKFSKWMEWARTTHFTCCSCGLTHTVQVRITKLYPIKRTVRLEVRMRTNKRRTKTRRAIMRRQGKL